jgi:hypothetical protein
MYLPVRRRHGTDPGIGFFAETAATATDPRTLRQCVATERRIWPIVEPPPGELVDVDPRQAYRGAKKLHRAAYEAYRRLKAAAEADGIPPDLLSVASGYRSIARQRELWAGALKRYGSAQAARKWVAPPGGSPHHTGRAIDFYLGEKNDSSNVARLRGTRAYQWLVCNADRFGFTPYVNEPWHWEFNPASLPASVPSTTPSASSAPSLPSRLLDMVRTGALTLKVALTMAAGERDEKTLTNMLFFARHPERSGTKIRPEEKSLAREWLEIRDRMVRPALRTLRGSGRPAVTAASPIVAVTVPGADVPVGPFGTLTLQLPGRPVVAYPFTREDVVWAARFIRGEAGGQDDANSRAVMWAMFNKYALRFAGKSKFRTFAEFLRTYSTTLQPHLINPDAVFRAIEYSRKNPRKFTWVQFGTKLYQGKDPKYQGKEIPQGQLQHHLDLQQMRWSQLPATVRSLAERLLKGDVPNPIGIASDFANTLAFLRRHVTKAGRDPKSISVQEWRAFTHDHAKRHKRIWIGERPELDQMRKNAFFIDREFVNVPPDAVRVARPPN